MNLKIDKYENGYEVDDEVVFECSILAGVGTYHSRLLESARDGFEKFIKNIEFPAQKHESFVA